jgi:hypothetical protein
MCDVDHARFTPPITRLTQHVISCRDRAQNLFPVTPRSRIFGEYLHTFHGNGRGLRQQVSGFWRSAIRSSWIPPVPETAGRQI